MNMEKMMATIVELSLYLIFKYNHDRMMRRWYKHKHEVNGYLFWLYYK